MVLEHFEHHNEKLLPRRDFYERIVLFGLLYAAIILISLVIGMAGYMSLEGLSMPSSMQQCSWEVWERSVSSIRMPGRSLWAVTHCIAALC